jgi:hypothetical protein
MEFSIGNHSNIGYPVYTLALLLPMTFSAFHHLILSVPVEDYFQKHDVHIKVDIYISIS